MAVTCDSPANLSASLDSNDNVYLEWDKPLLSNPDHYKIYRKRSDESSFTYIGDSDNESYTDTQIVHGYTYYYHVTSVCFDPEEGYVESDTSDDVSVYVPTLNTTIQDNLSSSDSATEDEKEFFKRTVSDTPLISDTFSISIVYKEVLNIDSISVSDITEKTLYEVFAENISDSSSLTDIVNVVKSLKEVSIDDSISVSDITEKTLYEMFIENISENSSLTDSVNVIKTLKEVNIDDSISVSDVIEKTLYGIYIEEPSDDSSIVDEVSVEVIYVEINIENTILYSEVIDEEIYANYNESGYSIYSCRTNLEFDNEYLKNALREYLISSPIEIIFNVGRIIAYDKIIEDENGLRLIVSFIAEAGYDGKRIVGIKVGNFEYNGLNIEVEGGYMYRISLVYNIDNINECVGGVYVEA